MRKKIIWAAVILLIVSIAGYKIKSGNQGLSYETSKAEKGDLVEYIEETGNILLEEKSDIYAVAAGRVVEVNKTVGDEIKAGELLARIDNNDLLLQIEALKAQRLAAAAKYDEARSSVNPDELRKLEALVRSSEAAYEDAKRNTDNSRKLYEAGAVSLDMYKASVTKLAAAEASLEAARSSLSTAKNGASINVRKQYEAQISEIETRMEQLKKKSEEMIIIAPINGMITESNIEAGSMVVTGAKIYEIGGSKGYYIECDILVEDIAGVKIGAPVIIENDDLGISKLKGTVRKIHPKAVSKMSDLGIEQKRVKVEINMESESLGLRPGYEVTVKIITNNTKGAVLIPEKAVFDYQGKPHVFINENGKAKLKAIEKGIESDEKVEVLKGITEGEDVIISPDETLEEGMKIK